MTNRTKKVLDELTSTMKINPDHYSLNVSPNRIKSLRLCSGGLAVYVALPEEHPYYVSFQCRHFCTGAVVAS